MQLTKELRNSSAIEYFVPYSTHSNTFLERQVEWHTVEEMRYLIVEFQNISHYKLNNELLKCDKLNHDVL